MSEMRDDTRSKKEVIEKIQAKKEGIERIKRVRLIEKIQANLVGHSSEVLHEILQKVCPHPRVLLPSEAEKETGLRPICADCHLSFETPNQKRWGVIRFW